MTAPIASLLSGAAEAAAFDNIHNLRDLGGLRSRDGRRVRAGRLFRSGSPGLASAADIVRLQALKLDAVIDFRSPEEKSEQEAAFAAAFDWIALPVMEGSMSMATLVPRLQAATRQEMDAFMLQVYREFPLKHQRAFGSYMQQAEAGRNLLYHCSTGKDRAGFATMLLLSALEVEPEAIMANYLESNVHNQRLIHSLRGRLATLGVDPEVAMPMLEVRAGYLEAALHSIEQEWGGTGRFLSETLGIDLQRVQSHYLEEAS
jgi:protein-tyrosine phosphatase